METEEEDSFDFGFDDDCYSTSWSMINMWYQRALKLRKLHDEKEKLNDLKD